MNSSAGYCEQGFTSMGHAQVIDQISGKHCGKHQDAETGHSERQWYSVVMTSIPANQGNQTHGKNKQQNKLMKPELVYGMAMRDRSGQERYQRNNDWQYNAVNGADAGKQYSKAIKMMLHGGSGYFMHCAQIP